MSRRRTAPEGMLTSTNPAQYRVLQPSPDSALCVDFYFDATIMLTVFLAAQCDVESLCGVPLSAGMRELLGLTPDWCTVLQECQVGNAVNA